MAGVVGASMSAGWLIQPLSPHAGAASEAAQTFEELIERALQIDPDSLDYVLALAEIAIARENFDQAEVLLRRAIELGGNLQVRLRLAEVQRRAGRPEDALATLEQLRDELTLEATARDQVIGRVVSRAPISAPPRPPTDAGEAAQAEELRELEDLLDRALQIDPDSLDYVLALADMAFARESFAQAEALLRRAIELGAGPASRLRLAEAQRLDGRPEAALATLERLRAEPSLPEAVRVETLRRVVELAAFAGRPQLAAESASEVLVAGRFRDPDLLATAVRGFLDADLSFEAFGLLRRALGEPSASEPVRSMARRMLADLLIQVGRTEQAIDLLAVEAADPDAGADVFATLGMLLQDMGDCTAALPVLEEAIARGAGIASYLDAVFCQQQLGRSAEAIAAIEQTLRAPISLDPGNRRRLYVAKGRLYAETGDLGRAGEAWRQALMLRFEPALAIRTARALRLTDRPDAALAMLARVEPKQLDPPARAAYFDEIGAARLAQADPVDAAAAFARAVRLEETSDRQARLGSALREAGRTEAAETALLRAIELGPDTADPYLQLAQLHRATGRDRDAAALLESALQRGFDRPEIYEDLAYALKATGADAAAAQRFRDAIDRRIARLPMEPAARRAADARLYRLRREVRDLERQIAGGAYLVLEDDANFGERAPDPLGARSATSQAGVELAWQPSSPWWRAGDLAMFGRTFWSMEDGGVQPEGDSLQAGIGLRVRPFDDHALFLSGERLVALGDLARDDWLLRASWSWLDSLDLDPAQERANFTSLSADVAVVPGEDEAWFLRGEAMQGVSFRFAPQLVATPHAVLAGHLTEGEATDSNLSVGAGLRLASHFGQTRYKTEQSSANLDLQYRVDLAGTRDVGGPFLRFALDF